MVTNEYLRLIPSGSLIVNQLIDALSHGIPGIFEILKKVFQFCENLLLQASKSSVYSTFEIIFVILFISVRKIIFDQFI